MSEAPVIPTKLDEITPDWLGAALEHGGLAGARVASIESASLGAGQGFMGQLARLSVRYEKAPDDAPTSLIAKLPTTDPGGRMMGQMLGLWERESRFYAEVAPQVSLRTPRCYANLADAANDAWALLLEDFAPVPSADQLAGASPEQARRAIREIATFHAQWWDDPRLAELDWMPAIDGPLTQALPPMFEAGWPVFLERYRDRVDPRTIGWAESFVDRVPDWLQSYAADPRSITHGDFRLDNMFFGPGDQFALVDWQMSMRSPPNADIVYFLATNLTPEVRRECETDLYRVYQQTLIEGGVDADLVSWDKLMRGYDEGLVFYTVMMGSGLERIDPSNERGAALFDALVMRSFSAAAERNAGESL